MQWPPIIVEFSPFPNDDSLECDYCNNIEFGQGEALYQASITLTPNHPYWIVRYSDSKRILVWYDGTYLTDMLGNIVGEHISQLNCPSCGSNNFNFTEITLFILNS